MVHNTQTELPCIKILATGGTIAGVQGHASSYVAGQLSANALVSALPDTGKIANIEVEQIANVGSQSMTADVWKSMLRTLYELGSQRIDAVVITHGTDTMEETAWFLQLAYRGTLPIILTGAMRPANAYGADGPVNLLDAIRTAASPDVRNKGVLVVMNGQIHSARYVQKLACEGLDAFESRENGPIGRVGADAIEWFYEAPAKKFNNCSDVFLMHTKDINKPFPRIPVFYATALCEENTLDALLMTKPQGIIIAGVGNGNISDQAIARLQQAALQGVVVVRASRCASGSVKRNLEVNDDACGFIVANDINPQKARLLLGLALQKTNNPARIQEFFNEH